MNLASPVLRAEASSTAGTNANRRALAVLPLVAALIIFAALAAYQLDLPGLHYDEAKEAGVNAMQLLTGRPVTAFRGAIVPLGPWRVPLMVQDYIGSLNVLLALPFLAAGGFTPVALRALPLVLALITLVFAWMLAARLGGPLAAGVTVLLLAVNPSFVFWSRQGIFVTNITALLLMAALWFGLLWWQERRLRHLIAAAFMCGLGVYAKLLFVWALFAMLGVAVVAYVFALRTRSPAEASPSSRSFLDPGGVLLAMAGCVLPLIPLIAFNLQTGGTLMSIFGNLGQSYYGVDNSAYGANLAVRLGQVVTLLRGSHFWYLGETYANRWAAWLFVSLVLLAAIAWLRQPRRGAFWPLLPLVLLVLVVLQSAFTVSDLFITHFALVVPLIPLTAGLAAGVLWQRATTAPKEDGKRKKEHDPYSFHHLAMMLVGVFGILLVLVWAGSDAATTIRYHRILSVSGGYAAHSDAIYDLADYLDTENFTAPVALDWGIDAPVQFLTAGRVNPIDVFGYTRIDAPDPGFIDRVEPYLEDWQTIYVAHAPENVVFKGRLEAMTAWAAERGWRWFEQVRFGQRSGDAVYIIHRFME